MELGDSQLTIALFQDFPIRRTWHDERWFYSVVDCMAPLSGSPDPNAYWYKVKTRMRTDEQIDVYELGVIKLSLPSQDGRKQKTDCADIQTLLRLVESVPSPNAEPLKRWLAKVGAAVVEDDEASSTIEARSEARMRLEMLDRSLHQIVRFRGIVTREQHQALTDANYEGLYDGLDEREVCDMRGILPVDDPRNFMGYDEIALHMVQRSQAAALIQRRNLQGPEAINKAASDVGTEIRLMLERLGAPMPEDLPRERPLSKGQYLPELRGSNGTGPQETQAIPPPVWEEK